MKTFISYSHDNEDHKAWVKDLADRLIKRGINIYIDAYDLDYGDDIAKFMEDNLHSNNNVLVVCTDQYIEKANAGDGGVGYEKTIITQSILKNKSYRKKLIPLVRGSGDPKVPNFFGSALYVDLTNSCTEADLDDLARRLRGEQKFKPSSNTHSIIPGQPPVEHKAEIFDPPPRMDADQLIVEFSNRMGKAFPGVRGWCEFSDEVKIEKRLGIFFKVPIVFSGGHLAWWWRDGNLQVESFERQEGRRYLMNIDEINISRICPFRAPNYKYDFIYVECNADEPTGLYSINTDSAVEFSGYADEEYGLVDGTLPVKRFEHDDGAANIDGDVIEILGRSDLRRRFITPYNFLIAANQSPINNIDFDEVLKTNLNKILRRESTLEDLSQSILSLPARGR